MGAYGLRSHELERERERERKSTMWIIEMNIRYPTYHDAFGTRDVPSSIYKLSYILSTNPKYFTINTNYCPTTLHLTSSSPQQ